MNRFQVLSTNPIASSQPIAMPTLPKFEIGSVIQTLQLSNTWAYETIVNSRTAETNAITAITLSLLMAAYRILGRET
jgi:hypothetical protein